jgi:hypothetical protein
MSMPSNHRRPIDDRHLCCVRDAVKTQRELKVLVQIEVHDECALDDSY